MTSSVLIVGAGPVGLTLASELARYGVPLRLVDRAPQRTDQSRALVLWSRTLELLDRGAAGGAAPFVAAGFRIAGVSVLAGETVVGRVTMDAVPSAHAYALALPQSETERLLEERLAGQGVAVERRTAADAVTVGPDGVAAVLRHADGREERVRADWLVGCDGAHSTVRHALGLPFAGETLPSDWILADLHMTGYPRPDTEASVHWHRDGVLLIFPIRPGRYRIIADTPQTDAEAAPAPTLDDVRRLVDRRGPAGTRLSDPVWLAGFRINGRKVAAYRQGRAFLAGDAAHIHSPAGGQGMNTGMQDAVNLAWKLALVAHGRADAALLDSYSPERSRVGDDVLKAAERLTRVATLTNPIAQGVRNAVARLVLGLPRLAHGIADTMAEVAIHYGASPLNGPGVTGWLRPGARVPPVPGQVPVGAGPAPRFVLFAEPSAAVAALPQAFAGLVDPEIRPALHNGTVALVRPDGYLACATPDPAAVAGYLARLAAPDRMD
ncbi:FAD-dependent monooxygenase [Methylobacterium terricola]|uniref:FAD-dependent monooxygenase n=1 Tax=Methylobacterium terricola TaxID=2583531 RepID=UPI001FEA8B24|nr:FAD-dependent monooxygenase [Methylobacterium terricola]